MKKVFNPDNMKKKKPQPLHSQAQKDNSVKGISKKSLFGKAMAKGA